MTTVSNNHHQRKNPFCWVAFYVSLCLLGIPVSQADQVIFIDVAHYIPADSQFGVEVKGNKWISFADPEAIGGRAFGGPGDNNYGDDGGDGAHRRVCGAPAAQDRQCVLLRHARKRVGGADPSAFARLAGAAGPVSYTHLTLPTLLLV